MELTGLIDHASDTLRSTQAKRGADLSRLPANKARDAAVEFEGFFISMALETMFSGIETNGLFGGGHGEKIFRSMMLQEYGKSIAERSGFGLADAVQREIISLQEVRNNDHK